MYRHGLIGASAMKTKPSKDRRYTMSISLDGADIDWLNESADNRGISRSELIRQMVSQQRLKAQPKRRGAR